MSLEICRATRAIGSYWNALDRATERNFYFDRNYRSIINFVNVGFENRSKIVHVNQFRRQLRAMRREMRKQPELVALKLGKSKKKKKKKEKCIVDVRG